MVIGLRPIGHHPSLLTVRARTRNNPIDVADGAGTRIDDDAHQNAAEIGRPQHIGRALAQRRRQRIEARPAHGSRDLVRRHEAGSGQRRELR